MGAAIYVVSSDSSVDVVSMMCGKSLARVADRLGRFAREKGLAELEMYLSQDPDELADFLDGEDVDDVELPAEEWFDGDLGIKVMEEYLQLLDDVDCPDDCRTEGVRVDLQDAALAIKAIAESGAKWHLVIDF